MTIGFNAIVGPNDTGGGSGSGGRTPLTADTTYYVRTDGSDSNNGLTNSAGGAFLTIAHAMTTVGALDCMSYQLTVQVGTGTWTTSVSLPRVLYGGNTPIFQGIGTLTVISNTAVGTTGTISSVGATPWIAQNLKLTSNTSLFLLSAQNGGNIGFGGIEFGACGGYQIYADGPSSIFCIANYTVSGGGNSHLLAAGQIKVRGFVATTTGPTFVTAFAYASNGYLDCFGSTFAGTATGPRYLADSNGVIFTNGGGASFFPGTVAGATTTGGQYL